MRINFKISLIALSTLLTACGGGGSGNGSSIPNTNLPTISDTNSAKISIKSNSNAFQTVKNSTRFQNIHDELLDKNTYDILIKDDNYNSLSEDEIINTITKKLIDNINYIRKHVEIALEDNGLEQLEEISKNDENFIKEFLYNYIYLESIYMDGYGMVDFQNRVTKYLYETKYGKITTEDEMNNFIKYSNSVEMIVDAINLNKGTTAYKFDPLYYTKRLDFIENNYKDMSIDQLKFTPLRDDESFTLKYNTDSNGDIYSLSFNSDITNKTITFNKNDIIDENGNKIIQTSDDKNNYKIILGGTSVGLSYADFAYIQVDKNKPSNHYLATLGYNTNQNRFNERNQSALLFPFWDINKSSELGDVTFQGKAYGNLNVSGIDKFLQGDTSLNVHFSNMNTTTSLNVNWDNGISMNITPKYEEERILSPDTIFAPDGSVVSGGSDIRYNKIEDSKFYDNIGSLENQMIIDMLNNSTNQSSFVNLYGENAHSPTEAVGGGIIEYKDKEGKINTSLEYVFGAKRQ